MNIRPDPFVVDSGAMRSVSLGYGSLVLGRSRIVYLWLRGSIL
jgi:hypothetical protein